QQLPDAELRNSIVEAVRALKELRLTGKLQGIAYGAPLGQRAGNPPATIRILTSVSPNESPPQKRHNGSLRLPFLGSFQWEIEPIGSLTTAAAPTVEPPPYPELALAHRSGHFGTLGAFVRLKDAPDESFGLTCAHVLLRESGDGLGSPALRWEDPHTGWVNW